jgi:hypothetical protein
VPDLEADAGDRQRGDEHAKRGSTWRAQAARAPREHRAAADQPQGDRCGARAGLDRRVAVEDLQLLRDEE